MRPRQSFWSEPLSIIWTVTLSVRVSPGAKLPAESVSVYVVPTGAPPTEKSDALHDPLDHAEPLALATLMSTCARYWWPGLGLLTVYVAV